MAANWSPRDPRHIRNLSIIAHVDHGKTTLSDTLIYHAGQLSREKAGNALVLDSSAQEKARGITIFASGISLVYDTEAAAWARAAAAESARAAALNALNSVPPVAAAPATTAKPAPAEPTAPAPAALAAAAADDDAVAERWDEDDEPAAVVGAPACDLYVGNLPFDVSEQQLAELLQPFGAVAAVALRARRGWALVSLADPAAAVAVERASLELAGRRLTIERPGMSPLIQLRQSCARLGLPAPVFEPVQPASTGVRVRLRVGDKEFVPASDSTSLKEARGAAAALFLRSLEQPVEQPTSAATEVPASVRAVASAASAAAPADAPLLLNLIDSPGHVDFSSEVTAALRLTDGALVVVDCIEGVCVQTETVLRQALAERVRPVLFLNKLDRAITELQLEPEAAHRSFLSTIAAVNAVIATYQDPALPDQQVSIEAGTVAFGAGKQGWAFTLDSYADRYAARGVDKTRFLQRFTTGSSERRDKAFCELLLGPIYEIFRAVSTGDAARLDRRLDSLAIRLTAAERELPAKDKLKRVMQSFLPAAECLLRLVLDHLPSPVEAQRYRVDKLYDGPLDDACATAVRRCAADGPVMVYVSKLIPIMGAGGRFYAFGRVFAGTVRAGQQVVILDPQAAGDDSTRPARSHQGRIRSVMAMMGAHAAALDEACPGQIIGLTGLDAFIQKSATVTTAADAHPLRAMRFSVSPVVRMAVATRARGEATAKLADGLRLLSKADPCLLSYVDAETREHVVAGAGELHLDVCLQNLQLMLGDDIELTVSEPMVALRETVTERSGQCLAKSTNKLNRVYFTAEPLAPELVDELESRRLSLQEPLALSRALVQRFGWSQAEARSVWACGPEEAGGTNMLVDGTTGVQHLQDIRDSVIQAFRAVTSQGVVARERLSGVRFTLVDAVIHADSSHRGPRQIVTAAERAMFAALLSARPAMMEPVYAVEIQAPETVVGTIYSVLTRRRGQVRGDDVRVGTPLHVVTAFLPVIESLGFTGALSAATSGQAFTQARFDHWQPLPGDPLAADSLAATMVGKLRQRKQLPAAVPAADQFIDRL